MGRRVGVVDAAYRARAILKKMWFRRTRFPPASTDVLRCSFCRKSQDVVAKLISSPNDYPRAYICDECVAVCASILEDDAEETKASVVENSTAPVVSSELDEETHSLLTHPLALPFFAALELWIKRESLGCDAAEEFAEMRRIAVRMMRGGSNQ